MADSAARRLENKLFGPPARLLLRAHLTPNAVTIAGTVIVVAAALVLYPRGYVVAATLTIAVIACTDSLDGTMARLSGRSSEFGAFLDSTLDRVADAAVFAGIALYFFGPGRQVGAGHGALACLVCAFVISYARSRAETFGFDAHVGIAERTPRLVIVLALMLAEGLGAPAIVALVGLWLLAALCAVTAGQRIAAVYRQSKRGVHPLWNSQPDASGEEKS